MTFTSNPNARALRICLEVLACLFLANLFACPLSQAAEPGPYDEEAAKKVFEPNWRTLTGSIPASRRNVLKYDDKKEDPLENRADAKPATPGPSKVLFDLVGQLIGLIWDLALDFVRPIAQSLIEHM